MHTMPGIKINQEQELFVIPCGNGFSCFGFENCFNAATQLATLLGHTLPSIAEKGTLIQYAEYAQLTSEYGKRGDLNSRTWFDFGTPKEVERILEQARLNGEKLRIFLGDSKTGRCWLEECDVVGYIGRSMGPMRAPILLKSKTSSGGGAILTACIVRILNNKCKELWCHPTFYIDPMDVLPDSTHVEYPWQVSIRGHNEARFKTQDQALRWVDFMSGRSLKP